MQQAIDPAQINERTIIGQIFDDALNGLAFLQVLQQLLSLGTVRRFHNGTARYHNVVALLVELDDLEFQLFTFEMCGLPDRPDIDQ